LLLATALFAGSLRRLSVEPTIFCSSVYDICCVLCAGQIFIGANNEGHLPASAFRLRHGRKSHHISHGCRPVHAHAKNHNPIDRAQVTAYNFLQMTAS
jgi:hypothetical protein